MEHSIRALPWLIECVAEALIFLVPRHAFGFVFGGGGGGAHDNATPPREDDAPVGSGDAGPIEALPDPAVDPGPLEPGLTVDASPADGIIEGGPGNDSLDGGRGDHPIFGNAGNDAVIGGPENDVVDGG